MNIFCRKLDNFRTIYSFVHCDRPGFNTAKLCAQVFAFQLSSSLTFSTILSTLNLYPQQPTMWAALITWLILYLARCHFSFTSQLIAFSISCSRFNQWVVLYDCLKINSICSSLLRTKKSAWFIVEFIKDCWWKIIKMVFSQKAAIFHITIFQKRSWTFAKLTQRITMMRMTLSGSFFGKRSWCWPILSIYYWQKRRIST